ncbi:hypothetical protein DFH08DRAFT_808586 [Mycena albidolilacea]|uniref:Uncharacterized protein n=1 Tax=Mycena albidolilacea TaxID=1033008 RepID=A0AAD7ESI0_9AGAR|nr:hypothetical protein DFH08DRAFT_808586 [Mycena albidolilacea]
MTDGKTERWFNKYSPPGRDKGNRLWITISTPDLCSKTMQDTPLEIEAPKSASAPKSRAFWMSYLAIMGGALASQGNKAWRWLFYLNLPLAGVAFTLVVRYLSVNHPEGAIRHKLAQVDWLGNAIVIAGTGLAIIGLTWGRIYEAKVPVRPAISLDVFGNRTSVKTTLATPPLPADAFTIPSILPGLFRASPIRSAVNSLPSSLITTPLALSAGVLFSAPIFPLLALPPTRAGSALAMFSFTRAFSQAWGISSTILQNSLKNLPSAFVAQFPPGFEIADAAIPTMIGIAGLGLLLSLLMKEVHMGTSVDKTYLHAQEAEDSQIEGC